MDYDIHIGDTVRWKWGSGFASGTVEERFTDKVTRTIEGNEVTRNATDDEPAYLITQDDGSTVLKSVTEIESAN